jgi:hypothetical protein
MDDDEEYGKFSKDFHSYRVHPKFQGLDSSKIRVSFPASQDILRTAESLLFKCSAHEIIALSERVERIIKDHREAVYLGERKNQLIHSRSMDMPSNVTSLKEAGAHFAGQFYASIEGQTQLFDYDEWANLFAVLSLINLAGASQTLEREHPDILSASMAIIDAMDVAYFGLMMSIAGGFWREEHKQNARRGLNGKRLLGATTRVKIAKEERDKIEAERRAMLSMAGMNGAMARRNHYEPIKLWALKEAANRRGAHKQIARQLSSVLPPHLADISNDPERLIYDTLRASKKP